jgi:biopolymer transport protein TolR
MHGRRSHEDDEPMADMNFIPLIDIALTLVIILMVTTAFIKHPGVSLKLPETVTREGAPETNKDFTILVSADGGLVIDGRRRTINEVKGHLQLLAKKDKQARVLVKGDRNVPYARVMDVMDVVRQAGLTRVVLPTDPKNEQPAKPTASASAGGAAREVARR